jgi:rubredoxin
MGSAEVDENGKVSCVGPMVVKTGVKPGHEIEGINVKTHCPNCGHAAHIKSFEKVRVCPLTGQPADKSVQTVFGKMFVSGTLPDELVESIFSMDNVSCGTEVESILSQLEL